ncbi:DMT family transporter [Bacillus sp. CH126_4D]|uniref:DMT family transporter n=1 Tax=unclassified Bacillus (in: firmicutes) TaxID=185979 RepID=UPI00124EA7A1|nr:MULTISPECIES: DMT family transporter [unclassified Bacillus (in: firmicutes)]KAB2460458.1 DMT family transporter [Bacillus sp. CH140a_4T]KAB2468656.1 DMT family transporter [Bacillus sp. CH126_4D]
MLYITISILAGVSIIIARIINANLAAKIGNWEGTFFNYITGLFFSMLFLIFSSDSMYIPVHTLQSIPIAVYLGGLVGVIVISLSNYITPKISAFYLTLLIFIGQLFAGTIIDFILSHELSMGKVVGGIFVLIGLTYNLLVDRPVKTVQNNQLQL